MNGNPDNFTFHSSGKNGDTVIKRGNKVYKVKQKTLSPGLHGSYNAWHPGGGYIALYSNTTVQSFMARSRNQIEGYTLRG